MRKEKSLTVLLLVFVLSINSVKSQENNELYVILNENNQDSVHYFISKQDGHYFGAVKIYNSSNYFWFTEYVDKDYVDLNERFVLKKKKLLRQTSLMKEKEFADFINSTPHWVGTCEGCAFGKYESIYIAFPSTKRRKFKVFRLAEVQLIFD